MKLFIKVDNLFRFFLYLRLFIIMGVTWSMESISWMLNNRFYTFYVSDVLNCLQGFIIFVLFVWKPKVRDLIRQRLLKAKQHFVSVMIGFFLSLSLHNFFKLSMLSFKVFKFKVETLIQSFMVNFNSKLHEILFKAFYVKLST